MLRVALVVLIGVIIVIFAREFGRLFKKIFSIKGMPFFLPLILATYLIVHFEEWVLWGLLHIQYWLFGLTALLAEKIPIYLAKILIFIGFYLIPVFIINAWIKRKNYQSFKYSYLTGLVIWLVVATLLTLSQYY